MPTVVRADTRRAAQRARKGDTGLVVSVGASGVDRSAVSFAHVGVSVKAPALRERIEHAIARAVRAASTGPAEEERAVVRVPSRRAIERHGDRLEGALAVVPVTARNLRRLAEIVRTLRGAGVAGVQLAWNGVDPSREDAEARVFAVLESARGTPGQAPVVLARGEEPVEALTLLMMQRRRDLSAR